MLVLIFKNKNKRKDLSALINIFESNYKLSKT